MKAPRLRAIDGAQNSPGGGLRRALGRWGQGARRGYRWAIDGPGLAREAQAGLAACKRPRLELRAQSCPQITPSEAAGR